MVESWLARAARTRPDTRCGQRRSPTRRCTQRARATAAGLPRGARVGIALPPGEDYVVALHACLLAGALVVPVDLRLTEAERPAVDLLIDGELPAAPGDPATLATHDLDAPAIVVHTSGTTSRPKPIRLTYGNWLWSALGSAVALGVDPDERWLCTLPLSHVGGLSILLRSAIYGTTAIVHERFETDRVLARASGPPGPDRRLARPHDAHAAARRGPAAARPRCAGRCSAAHRCHRRCCSAPPTPAFPSRRPMV